MRFRPARWPRRSRPWASAGRKIATAVNGRFVAAAARPRTELADGDRIEVVAPMQGG
jgi:thiamine biosynthesis protein ThiS